MTAFGVVYGAVFGTGAVVFLAVGIRFMLLGGRAPSRRPRPVVVRGAAAGKK